MIYLSIKAYINAKANIFKWQKPSDIAVINLDNPDTKKIGTKVLGRRLGKGLKFKVLLCVELSDISEKEKRSLFF